MSPHRPRLMAPRCVGRNVAVCERASERVVGRPWLRGGAGLCPGAPPRHLSHKEWCCSRPGRGRCAARLTCSRRLHQALHEESRFPGRLRRLTVGNHGGHLRWALEAAQQVAGSGRRPVGKCVPTCGLVKQKQRHRRRLLQGSPC